ncbi:platelet factor 4-like [Ambystoma mexicanum]|uniref:platelet factor 4-like n=1 Tax=Ambystoma mexicanum TaxID=8296 RepID=UPI0037E8220B
MHCKCLALCAVMLAFPFPKLRPEHSAMALHAPTRCLCLKTIDSIARRFIKDFTVVHEGSHCSAKELILNVKVKNKATLQCLDPSKKQGKQLLSCWKRIKQDERKKGICIKRKGRKRQGGKKQTQRTFKPKQKKQ